MRCRHAARFSHGAILLDGFGTNPGGARGQRAERQRAPHVILAQRIARRRLRVLFRGNVASRQSGTQRIEELSQQPPVDDLPLTASSFRQRSVDEANAPPRARVNRYFEKARLVSLRDAKPFIAADSRQESRTFLCGSTTLSSPT